MIFARDEGRMCNNILQYAHVYAWAREHGHTAVSIRFAHKYKYFRICHTFWHNFFTYAVVKLLMCLRLLPVVSFKATWINPAVLEQRMLTLHHFILEGWNVRFYDLLLKYRQDIVTLFQFDDCIEAAALRTMALATTQPGITLGLHIRRGDYSDFEHGRYFYSDEQYAGFVHRFVNLLPPGQHITVYICSNDPQLDHDYYRHTLPDSITLVFPNGNQAEDLCLFSHCDYLIGPPSTYTLVAALYRDLPLLWVEQADEPFTLAAFKRFDYHFRHLPGDQDFQGHLRTLNQQN